jgi:CheY-like chemotaxis protein
MKVLVVDDDHTILCALARVVKHWGGEVECVDNAAAAAAAVEGDLYDVVLLDLRMPGKDGVWFVGNAEVPDETKVVLMTAYIPAQILSKLFEAGVDEYLEKPFSCSDLTHLLDRYAVA